MDKLPCWWSAGTEVGGREGCRERRRDGRIDRGNRWPCGCEVKGPGDGQREDSGETSELSLSTMRRSSPSKATRGRGLKVKSLNIVPVPLQIRTG